MLSERIIRLASVNIRYRGRYSAVQFAGSRYRHVTTSTSTLRRCWSVPAKKHGRKRTREVGRVLW